MLSTGLTPRDRQNLAEKTGVPLDSILELVKLSDLSRLGSVKTVRTRLYYDAGIDSVEKMAGWEPEELRNMLLEFVERTGFDGIATLPKEAVHTIEAASKLPIIVKL